MITLTNVYKKFLNTANGKEMRCVIWTKLNKMHSIRVSLNNWIYRPTCFSYAELGVFLDVRCPQSCVDEIPQQFCSSYLILSIKSSFRASFPASNHNFKPHSWSSQKIKNCAVCATFPALPLRLSNSYCFKWCLNNSNSFTTLQFQKQTFITYPWEMAYIYLKWKY